jgi:glycosyltransferase involved in cell wall biosynthesis
MYKVLMLAPTPFFSDRGCHVRIYEESRELERQGCRVEIITYSLGRDLPGMRVHRTIPVPFYKKLGAGPSYTKLFLDTLLCEKAMGLVRRFKPDIIHAHLHEGCLAGVVLRRFYGTPLVFDCQGSLSGESMEHGFVSPGSIGLRVMSAAEKWLNESADLIFTSSEYLCSSIPGRVDPGRVVALGDGVDTNLFRPCGNSQALRDMLGIPPGSPVVVFLGLLNLYQGVELLLRAAQGVLERHSGVYFLVMGYPDEDRYRAKAREMGLAEYTRFPGRIDYFHAPAYLSVGTIAVGPKVSRTESNGKLLNYMACGLPVAAFDTAVNRELLGDNAAYASLAGDHETSAKNLSEKIVELLEDERVRSELAQSGRNRAVQEFGWDRIGRKMMRYYKEIVQ